MKNVVHDLFELRKILQRFETFFLGGGGGGGRRGNPGKNVEFANLSINFPFACIPFQTLFSLKSSVNKIGQSVL